MRRAAKVDENQPEIVSALRQAGESVAHTHMVGGGFTDIVSSGIRKCPSCGYGMVGNFLIEIKNGDLPPSRQKLTEDEQAFFDSWRGQVAIARTIEEALQIVGKI